MTKDVAAPYYLFLKDELLPDIAGRGHIDPTQRTLWSYSLSGSFATWLNYYDPSLFRNYILSSPNWGQFGIQQRLMEGSVFKAPGADHRVFLSFDYGKEMTPDLDTKLRAFAAGPLPGYTITYSPTRGETHTTSWFVMLPAALRFIYGPG